MSGLDAQPTIHTKVIVDGQQEREGCVDNSQDESETTEKKRKIVVDTNTNPSMATVVNADLSGGIAELIFNAYDAASGVGVTIRLDEQTQCLEISNPTSIPFAVEALTYAPSGKELDNKQTGKFGCGLKDAIAIAHNNGLEYRVSCNNQEFVMLQELSEKKTIQFLLTDCRGPDNVVVTKVAFGSHSKINWKTFYDAAGAASHQCWAWLVEQKILEPLFQEGALCSIARWKRGAEPDSGCVFVHGKRYSGLRRRPLLAYNLNLPKALVKGRDRVHPPKGWSDKAAALFARAEFTDPAVLLINAALLADETCWEYDNSVVRNAVHDAVVAISEREKNAMEKKKRLERDIEAAQEKVSNIDKNDSDPSFHVKKQRSEMTLLVDNARKEIGEIPAPLLKGPLVSVTPKEKVPKGFEAVLPPGKRGNRDKVQHVPTVTEVISRSGSGFLSDNERKIQTAIHKLLSVCPKSNVARVKILTGRGPSRWDVHLNTLFVRHDSWQTEDHSSAIEEVISVLKQDMAGFNPMRVLSQSLLRSLEAVSVSHDDDGFDGYFCPLLVIDEWGCKTGGIASFNMQLATDLARLRRCHVYVFIFGEEYVGELPDGISLVKPLGNGLPNLSGAYHRITTLIGHAHQLLLPKFQQVAQDHNFAHCTRWVFLHTCPEMVDVVDGKDYEQKQAAVLESVRNCSILWSVGPKIHDYWKNKVGQQVVALFPPTLNTSFTTNGASNGTYVLCFGRTDGVLRSKGIKLLPGILKRVQEMLAIKSPVTAAKLMFVLRGVEDRKQAYLDLGISESDQFLMRHYGDRDDVRRDLQDAALCLMPSVSEPFGLVGLEAIAAGVLALVPNNSGLGMHLSEHLPQQLTENIIINNIGTDEVKTTNWANAISYWLCQPESIKTRVLSIRTKLSQIIPSVELLQSQFGKEKALE